METMKTPTVAAPQLSAEEAEAKRKVESMLDELEQLNRETRDIQHESDIIAARVDARLARLRARLGA